MPSVLLWSSTIAGDTWAVYLYLWGSDLETNFASASRDLEEALGGVNFRRT